MDRSAPQAVALISGGLDSMVAGARAREAGFRLLALTVDYGQRHRVELEAARRIAADLGAERHIVLPLDLRAFGGSALTDDIDVPRFPAGNSIPVTYVPARNTIFLSLALGWAEAAGARDLFIGVNALDYSGYPDCRPAFVAAFENLAGLATKAGVEGEKFTVHAPLLHLGKADIVREALRLGLDAAQSWSCYDPVPSPAHAGSLQWAGAEPAPADQSVLHCGRCESCALRARGFAEAGIPDPTLYAMLPDGVR